VQKPRWIGVGLTGERFTTALNGALFLAIAGHHFFEVGDQCLLNFGSLDRILWRGVGP
jgi:hypothetical protein